MKNTRFAGPSRDRRRGPACDAGNNHRWFGYSDDEEEAARAYDPAAVEAFGEFAWVNFSREWPPQRREEVHSQWLNASKREEEKAVRPAKRRCADVTKKSTKVPRTSVQKAPGKKAKRDSPAVRRKAAKCTASGKANRLEAMGKASPHAFASETRLWSLGGPGGARHAAA